MTAIETVKAALRLAAKPVVFGTPEGNALQTIREQEAARKAVDELPVLAAKSVPFYASVDEGQCGVVVAAHLSADDLAGLPWHLATEMLDDLVSSAAAAHPSSPPEMQRSQILVGYGPALAELICEGLDEALASRRESHKRLRDYDGNRIAPLDSEELDEPYYEDCDAAAEFATPATSFDFYHAIESARELIEMRDGAAIKARRGL